MKTVKELKEKLEQGVPDKVGDLDVTYEDGGDLDFKLDGMLVAWIGSAYFKEDSYLTDIHLVLNVASGKLFKYLRQVIQVGEWLDLEMDYSLVATKEVIKEVESPEQHKLSGKVEAYENILLGREVNIGK